MKFSAAAIFFQILLIVLFATLVRYDPAQSGPDVKRKRGEVNQMSFYYSSFQDVQVMIFVGIAYLIIFLRKYGYSALGYNFFMGALAVQWYIIVGGCLEHRGKTGFEIDLNLRRIITAEFAAAVILISFGAFLGKVNRLQILVICIIEVVMYSVNEFILVEEIQVADVGGSMIVHIFACYFGLALSYVIRKPVDTYKHPNEGAVYNSDLFAMIGSLFLWIYWPSFNSVLVTPGNDQQRAVINTYLSMTASCVTVFAMSSLVNKRNKLEMAHVQNATLAGGVALGTTANMLIEPWAAILLGFLSGLISVVGFKYVSPFLNKKFHLHDTCGIHNLHGMPGFLAGIAGIVATSLADRDTYKDSLVNVFPAVGKGRPIWKQAGYQALGIVLTFAISIVSGAITGLIVKQNVFNPPAKRQLFDDDDFWELPQISQTSNDLSDTEIIQQSIAKTQPPPE